MYNNHCYKLNSNINSFVHTLNNKEVKDEEKETYEKMKLSLSSKFYFRDFDKEANKIFVENLDDTIAHIKENTKRKNINFITNTDLRDILFQMIDNK